MNLGGIWIGLAEVKPTRTGLLSEGATGAFVQIVAAAKSVEEFNEKVSAHLCGRGFELVETSDVEPILQRMSQWEVETELIDLAQSVAGDGVTREGVFDSFSEDDESDVS